MNLHSNRAFWLIRHQKWLFAIAAIFGTVLMLAGAHLFRIDRIRCTNWPSLSIGWPYAFIYALALILLTLAWLGISNLCIGKAWSATSEIPIIALPPSRRFILLLGVGCNVLATMAPPFLADDGLAYAAIGRAMAKYHQDMFTPLGESLPASDIFRIAISQNYGWLEVGSAYAPGFNWLAWLIGKISDDNLTLSLRLFQTASMIAAICAGLIAGRAARLYETQLAKKSGLEPPVVGLMPAEEAVELRATSLLLLCPLTIIEASNNAHNDSFLMLSVALFALFVVQRKPILAFTMLATALLVKASALLLLGFYGIHQLSVLLNYRLPKIRYTYLLFALFIAVLITGLFAWQLLPWLMHYSSTTARLFGSPTDQYPYCTRSYECLPRGLLHMVLGMRTASWLVGLAFRSTAAAFLVYTALRSERGIRHLSWAASFIFLYYLFLHGYSHPWYILSLLPLLPYANKRLLPAMLTLPIANLSHYLLDFPYNCDHSVFMVGLTETIQGLMVLLPSTILLFRRQKSTKS